MILALRTLFSEPPGLFIIAILSFFVLTAAVRADTTGLISTYEQALHTQMSRGQNTEPGELMYQVSKKYLDASQTQSILESLEIQNQSQESWLQQTSKRIESGLARKSELHTIRISTALTQAQIAAQRLELEHQLAALEQLTGTQIASIAQLTKPANIVPPPRDKLDDLLQIALKHHASYQKALKGRPDTLPRLEQIRRRMA